MYFSDAFVIFILKGNLLTYLFSNYVGTLQEMGKAELTEVVSSIRLARKHGKHVGQCMFEFAVE